MPLIVLWLVVAAAIATVYFRFIAFRAFGHAVDLIKGDYSNPKDAGEVSHFQALATALRVLRGFEEQDHEGPRNPHPASSPAARRGTKPPVSPAPGDGVRPWGGGKGRASRVS